MRTPSAPPTEPRGGAQLYPCAARLVELRDCAGLTEVETAEALGISTAPVNRAWGFANDWLLRQFKLPARG